MSRLQILLVSKSTGGLRTYICWLAGSLDLNRFQITIVCLSEGGAELAAELSRYPDIETLSWPMNRFKINPATDAMVFFRLFYLIRNRKFDVIHAHGSKAGFLTRISAAGSGTPVMYSPHGFAFDAGNAPRWVRSIYTWVEKVFANWLTARIVTVSDAERQSALQRGVGKPELFTTIHSGIELKHLDFPADKHALRQMLGIPLNASVIGTVGRLNLQKAPFDFVRFAALLHQTRSQIYFVWVGDGDLMESSKSLARQLGVESLIKFLGVRSDVYSLLRGMDCFLLTSRWEAFPIVLLEAMALQLPVVAYNLPGIDEIVVDGFNGYLCPVGDTEALRAAVEKIIDDRDHATQLGLHGRDRIAQFYTREKMIHELENIYLQVSNTRCP